MKTTLILAASLLLVGTPLAVADESKADCEANQPWIGYLTSEPIRQQYEARGSPGGLKVCEGEHWDGQDSVQPGQGESTTAPCAASSTNPDDLFVGLCQPSDVNAPPVDGPNPLASLTPVGARAGEQKTGSGNADREAYVSANILLVGRAALYVGHCDRATGGTLEGNACGGSQETRGAVYLRDNSLNNLLATVVSTLGITRGYVSEGDCDQATYQAGAMANDRTRCGRDNTAITVNQALP